MGNCNSGNHSHSIPPSLKRLNKNKIKNQNMECLPKRIIIADEELADGVNLGYYPDLRKQLEQNECKILSFDEFKAKKYPILGSSSLDFSSGENILLVLDPHSVGRYIDCMDADIEKKMVISKCIAYREILYSMGAKEIKIVHRTSDETIVSKNMDIKANGRYGAGDMDVEANRTKKQRDKEEWIQTIEETTDSPEIRSLQEIETIMMQYSLYHDTNLIALYNRLKSNQKLNGTKQKINITFSSEVENSTKLAINLKGNFGEIISFGSAFGTENTKEVIQKFEQTIEVKF